MSEKRTSFFKNSICIHQPAKNKLIECGITQASIQTIQIYFVSKLAFDLGFTERFYRSRKIWVQDVPHELVRNFHSASIKMFKNVTDVKFSSFKKMYKKFNEENVVRDSGGFHFDIFEVINENNTFEDIKENNFVIKCVANAIRSNNKISNEEVFEFTEDDVNLANKAISYFNSAFDFVESEGISFKSFMAFIRSIKIFEEFFSYSSSNAVNELKSFFESYDGDDSKVVLEKISNTIEDVKSGKEYKMTLTVIAEQFFKKIDIMNSYIHKNISSEGVSVFSNIYKYWLDNEQQVIDVIKNYGITDEELKSCSTFKDFINLFYTNDRIKNIYKIIGIKHRPKKSGDVYLGFNYENAKRVEKLRKSFEVKFGMSDSKTIKLAEEESEWLRKTLNSNNNIHNSNNEILIEKINDIRDRYDEKIGESYYGLLFTLNTMDEDVVQDVLSKFKSIFNIKEDDSSDEEMIKSGYSFIDYNTAFNGKNTEFFIGYPKTYTNENGIKQTHELYKTFEDNPDKASDIACEISDELEDGYFFIGGKLQNLVNVQLLDEIKRMETIYEFG